MPSEPATNAQPRALSSVDENDELFDRFEEGWRQEARIATGICSRSTKNPATFLV
jgi:hypothetical protein